MSTSDATRRILVTGGAGFIGSHIVDALLARGDRVTVLDDLSTGRRENLSPDAELHETDIRSPEAARLIEESGFDAMIHQAAQMDVRRSTQDPGFDASVNILGTLNLLSACARSGVRNVLFASTGGAIYGEQDVHPATEDHPTRPVSPYGVSKLAVERYLYYFHVEYGLNATCLRYGNVYGERQNPHGEAGVVAIFLGRLLDGDTCVVYGDGEQTRDYIHVSDVVAANLAALDGSGFRTYNVGTGREASVLEILSHLQRFTGSDQAAEHQPARPGEQRRSSIDPARLQADLSVEAPLSLAEGLERTTEWFRERRRAS